MSILIFIAFYRFYKISPLLGFVTVIMVALSYNFIMDNYIEFIHNIGLGHFLREGTLKEGSGRYVAWDFAIEHIKENPYFGKGFVHEEYIYYAHGAQKRLNMLGHEGCSHNSYLAQTLNTGLIGAGLFFGAFIVKFMNASKKSIIAMPVLYSILFAANFEAFWIASLNPYTILIIVTATILTENEFNSEEKKATFSLL